MKRRYFQRVKILNMCNVLIFTLNLFSHPPFSLLSVVRESDKRITNYPHRYVFHLMNDHKLNDL